MLQCDCFTGWFNAALDNRIDLICFKSISKPIFIGFLNNHVKFKITKGILCRIRNAPQLIFLYCENHLMEPNDLLIITQGY
ncbi:hypothetical protein D3C87_1665330 [compost metagenome]